MQPNDRTQNITDNARPAGLVREGVTAGAVAASGVALWYLFRDFVAGHPLFTPRMLGQGLGELLGIWSLTDATTAVAAYTLVHFVAFLALGIVAAAVVRLARREATVLAGAFLIFAIAETAFFIGIGLINQGTLAGMLGWSQLAAGNIIGCALMAFSLWRKHPELSDELRVAMHGTAAWSVR
jgi:hypothetical protein